MFIRICLLAALAIAMPGAAQAGYVDIIVWLEPSAEKVGVGETVDIDLMAEFTNPIVAWGLDLEMDPMDRTAITAITVGGSWVPIDDTLDHDGLGGIRLGDGVSGEVLLATLTFEGLLPGDVNLILTGGKDEDEGFLLETGFPETNVGFVWGSLTVVPEPVAFGLLTMSAVAALRRRRR